MNVLGKFAVGAAFLTSACGGAGDQARPVESAAGHSGMEGMAMSSMQMPSVDMLPGMRAHLDSLRGAGPNEVSAMVGPHRAMAEAMFAAMDQDMKAMNMAGDAGWHALADSARADLPAMAGETGEALVLRMRAHAGRMRRLLQMHEGMMRMM